MNRLEALQRLKAALGPAGFLDAPADVAPYLRETRDYYVGACDAVVRPASVAEVAETVRLCAAAKLPLVPQGGNTGRQGGAVPDGGILLSTTRLNRIREVDAANLTLTAEAGCVLATIQAAAAEAGCLFPLSLAAEGSCQIGGNIASNAGGLQVVRYGNTRDLVLGLEVVLPDGRIWDGLRALRKDNTGYDLKHLFIGSEGTLGVITAAVLKLYPAPETIVTALVAAPSLEALFEVFAAVRDVCGEALTAFEMMPRIALEFVLAHAQGAVDPFSAPHAFYGLVELSSPIPEADLRSPLEKVLARRHGDGILADAVIADSVAQRNRLWALREAVPDAQKPEGVSIKHDVSVPVSRIVGFVRQASDAVEREIPGVRVVAFGHMGDGNVHFNLTQPAGWPAEDFMAQWARMNRIVHDIVEEFGGSISAEHGIGRRKKDELLLYKTPVEIELMRAVKKAIDPANLMNPGKVIDV